MKYMIADVVSVLVMSPSMRREWIEITGLMLVPSSLGGLPPCGGSGLKLLGYDCKYDLSDVSLHAEGVD